MKLLLEKGADVDGTYIHYGTALQWASFRGDYTIVKFLLEKGANANAPGGPMEGHSRQHHGVVTMQS